ncbi:hypothetical protein HDU87_000676 [Geranomyces variabilis]|uniref:Ketosynthase family 3 (KS3) domain-containing protein n=1 Tax=Geranomyces variabilis TaxID=109894 RepID=A0AAD5XU41_9FUNG|nr:hypothetical protein HDU87_000676 [Geranomyces variabilis]
MLGSVLRTVAEPLNAAVYFGAPVNSWISSSKQNAATDPVTQRYPHLLDGTVSSRAAYHLKLNGPNLTVNTACSSALVALSLAIETLRADKASIAVVGGVSVDFPQEGYATAADGRSLFSPSGICRPLDAGSDGAVPGDAMTAVVLKRASDARRDGNRIYAVVKGVEVLADGEGRTGYNTPHPTGQVRTIERALRGANVSADQIGYVEMHASGTMMGDAIEFEALRKALGPGRNGGAPTVIASNKGNFGNTMAASGLVSLIKVAFSLHNKVIPPMPSTFTKEPNPLLELGNRFVIPATAMPMRMLEERSERCFAGVTSLGYGGVNVHTVLASATE